jgi:dihydrodipicolinate synthase/N-acetylneuraminate lyase
MKTTPVTVHDLEGVIAVPPLAWRQDGDALDIAENERLLRHLLSGGLTRVLYGGNAFLYHVSLRDYECLVEWLASVPGDVWLIPGIGPTFGRAIDQARVLRRFAFPTALLLPCSDPRDPRGLERGVRRIAETLGCPLALYLKEETTFGTAQSDGIEAVARLVSDGLCVAIKYAVVRADPDDDPYLDALLAEVDRRVVVSGMGERPAVTHMLNRGLPGFTTGSGCVAPRLSHSLFEACRRRDEASANAIRARFLPLEDVRDTNGPARVLHAALQAAGIARVGPIPPFVSSLTADQIAALQPVVRALVDERDDLAGSADADDRRGTRPTYEVT